jgi:hypothetical protein
MMLAVSLALHVGVATGLALSFFYSSGARATASNDVTPPSVLLLRAQRTPGLPVQPAAPAQAIIHPAALASLPTIPAPVPMTPPHPVPEKTAPVALPTAALAPEANPNANVRALPSESVLSPSPAPNLNGADGVVFILDISGSMYEPYAGSTRLAFARQALSQRIRALKDGTPFAITLYAKTACNSGPLVAAANDTREAAVRYLMREVDCGGGTNLPAGFASAMQLHAGSFVLASDGDWNMSAAEILAQSGTILGPRGHCPSLVIIGIAPRSNPDAEPLMESLADQQGGSYASEQLENSPALVSSATGPAKPPTAAR